MRKAILQFLMLPTVSEMSSRCLMVSTEGGVTAISLVRDLHLCKSRLWPSHISEISCFNGCIRLMVEYLTKELTSPLNCLNREL